MKQLETPPLAEGEIYIGAIGDKNGDVYHLVLLPGDNDRAPHATQVEWAKRIGGELPNKLEAAMLFSHAKDAFEPAAYWTGETLIDPEDPENAAWAWCQDFLNGYQTSYHKILQLRARAVRRLPI
jgi:hypothetical protein